MKIASRLWMVVCAAIILYFTLTSVRGADLATCEWVPNSNRSIVDPVVAIQRLDMPPAMRVELAAKIEKHHFDDVVTIMWASINSDTGSHHYEPEIVNMNFANGRLCRAITRNTWRVDHEEGALVYLIGDRAFGYAAACGNLFELRRIESRQPHAASELVAPEAVAAETFDAGQVDPPEPGLTQAVASPDVTNDRPGGYQTLPVFDAPGGLCCARPISAVPEPAECVMLGVGLIVLALLIKLWPRNCKHVCDLNKMVDTRTATGDGCVTAQCVKCDEYLSGHCGLAIECQWINPR